MIFETFVKKNDGGGGRAEAQQQHTLTQLLKLAASAGASAEDLIKGVVYHPQMCVKPLLDQNILAAAASLSNSCSM